MRITQEQHDEIISLMFIEGYRSRSEFIRFVIKFYKYHAMRNSPPPEIRDGYKYGENANLRRLADACGDEF